MNDVCNVQYDFITTVSDSIREPTVFYLDGLLLNLLINKRTEAEKKIIRLFLCIYALKQLTKEERKQLVTEPNVYEQI